MFRRLVAQAQSCRYSHPTPLAAKQPFSQPRSWKTKHHFLIPTRNASTRTNTDQPARQSSSVLDALQRSSSRVATWLLIAISVYVISHVFAEHFFDYGLAYGISMLPTISSYGDTLIFSKWYRRGRDVAVGDVVCYRHPLKQDTMAVKRVVGMPGDYVLKHTPDAGDGMMIQVPEGHCWVNGDNLKHSRDSRHFGPLPLALITGKVVGTFRFGIPPQFERLDDSTALD